MSPPAANTRSRSATPLKQKEKEQPTQAHASGRNPPSSVGRLLSALTIEGTTPNQGDDEQVSQNAAAMLRVELFALLGADPLAHKRDESRAEFSSLLDLYSKSTRVHASDPIFCIGRNYFGMKEYKVVIIGGASVGKSAYIEKIKTNRFTTNYTPTENVEVTTIVFNTNHVPIKVDIWDIPGSNTFDVYYIGANAAILMYDAFLTSRSSSAMTELTAKFNNLVRVCYGESIPIVMMGNKTESNSKRKIQQKNAAVTFRRKKKLTHYAVSTKNGLNLHKPIIFLLKKLTGKDDLELVGQVSEQKQRKSNEDVQVLASASTESGCKSTPNDSPNDNNDVGKTTSKLIKQKKEVKPKSDISIAAATPLPKIGEEGI